MTKKQRKTAEAEKHLREEKDEELSSLRLFLADPVSKQAIRRLKKKEKELSCLQ